MKALKELELRQFLLLKYREKICLSNQMEDKFEIDVVDHYLWQTSMQIHNVQQNKIKFLDNPEFINSFLLEFDEMWSHIN